MRSVMSAYICAYACARTELLARDELTESPQACADIDAHDHDHDIDIDIAIDIDRARSISRVAIGQVN